MKMKTVPFNLCPRGHRPRRRFRRHGNGTSLDAERDGFVTQICPNDSSMNQTGIDLFLYLVNHKLIHHASRFFNPLRRYATPPPIGEA